MIYQPRIPIDGWKWSETPTIHGGTRGELTDISHGLWIVWLDSVTVIPYLYPLVN